MEMTLAQLKRNKDYLEKQLGETFKKARQARGLGQHQVARAMDVSRYTIARFEDGHVTVLSISDILVLAEYLGIALTIPPDVGRPVNVSPEADTQEEYDPDLPCNKKGCSISFRAYCCGCDEMLAYEVKKKGEQ